MAELSIPDEAVPYILYQRTQYLSAPSFYVASVQRGWVPWQSYRGLIEREAALRGQRVKSLYAQDMQREMASLEPHLPPTAHAILDVGCGVAGIDVYLQRHFAPATPHFYLLDKSRVEDRVFYGYKQRGAFYNSLQTAEHVLTANGTAPDKVTLLEANDAGTIAIDEPIDLALSLISWGYHYPVATYLDRVYELLAPGGRLILDVRRGSGGSDELRRKFGAATIISAGKKAERIVAVKQ